MKIQHSDVSLFSSHHKYHEIKEEENLNIWNRDEDAPERLQRNDRFEPSDNLKKLEHTKKADYLQEDMFDMPLDSKTLSILRALEALIGKKINISFYRKAETAEIEVPKQHVQDSEVERLGWGVEYSYSRTEIREEMLKFSAKGSVSTEDGKEIDFKLALKMQKSSIMQENISFKAGDALIDPLVLNFGNNTVTMSDIKHNFDLDLDGKEDEFSFVGKGSGFLALDKNSDGIINDGSELFGPTLGNGFEELLAYDSDKNNWIDENDAVFEKLLIWTKDEDGNEQLFRLKDKDVGALYLDRVNTDFELQNSDNFMIAKMRESSIYLNENGGVGTLQEIDLVI
ncbi:MAG: hypothetical protein OQK48_02110 [Sulfurimonas sp.]|uniref:hypothetical protein n=1 Tax=Sulfurimonas sp. TaxID=2022749 RepID=UPI00261A0B7E|nr:hypothetical protein [Sulfurimonas sp.]MCW8894873.1 hypothetical protein [Sulfurimonas sp.]MCW8953717.1 hypothetical protein [Sulfurimonas sp.]MCW9067741.1 hypothetical protein [Sulfurimonas sp.]